MKKILAIYFIILVAGCSQIENLGNKQPAPSKNHKVAEEMRVFNGINTSPKTKAVISYLKRNSPTIYGHFLKKPEKFIEIVEGSFYGEALSPNGSYSVALFGPGRDFKEMVTYTTFENEWVSQLITITFGKQSKIVEEFDGRSDLYNVTFERDNIKYFLEGMARCIKYSKFNALNENSNRNCNINDPKAFKLELADGLYSVFSMYPSKGGMGANQNTYDEVEFRYNVKPEQIFTCFLTSSQSLFDSDVNYKKALNYLYSTKNCAGSLGVLLGPFVNKEAMMQAFEDGERYSYSLGPWYYEDSFNCKNNVCK